MKIKIKIFLLILLAIFLIQTTNIFAAGGTVTVGSATGNRGDTVEIQVTIAPNPGISDAVIWFDIPKGLTLTDFDGTDGMNIDTFFSKAADSKVFLLNREPVGYTGSLLVTMVIKIEETAALGENIISIIAGNSSFSNADARSFPVTYTTGSVTVTEQPASAPTPMQPPSNGGIIRPTPIPSPPLEPKQETITELWQNSFDDVDESDWFYKYVKLVNIRGLFNGTSANAFSPDISMTRAMVITVLHRMSESPNVGDGVPDDPQSWYLQAVLWGIANSITDGSDLDSNVTREQLAALIYRFQRYSGKIPPDVVMGREYTDWNEISDWAKNAVNVLTIQDILRGKSDNETGERLFDPQSTATRAEAAAIFARFCEVILL